MRMIVGLLAVVAALSAPCTYAQSVIPAQVPSYNFKAATGTGISTTVADNGPSINALLVLAGNGQIEFPCGTFTFSTPIIDPAQALIIGQNQKCTILQYTGTTGTAITYSSAATQPHSQLLFTGHGLRDLTLQGPGPSYPVTGLQIGSSSTSNTQSAPFATMSRIKIQGFNYGLTWGSGTWDTLVEDSMFHTNNSHIYYPTGLTNSGEQIMFSHNLFADSSNTKFQSCILIRGAPTALDIAGGSIDDCQVDISAPQANVIISRVHFEWPGGESGVATRTVPFVTATSGVGNVGRITLRDDDVYMGGTVGAPLFYMSSAGSSSGFVVDGLYLHNNATNVDGTTVLPAIAQLASGQGFFIEQNTHVDCLVASPCLQNIVQNLGTGAVSINTPPSISNTTQNASVGLFGTTVSQSRMITDPMIAVGSNNLVLQSNAFTTSPWSAFCGVTGLTATNDYPDPFGGNTTAWKMTSLTSPTNTCGTIQVGVLQNTNYLKPTGLPLTASLWVRTASGTGTIYIGAGTNVTAQTVTANWTRVYVYDTASATHAVMYIYLEPTGAISGGGHTVYIWGAQVNDGRNPAAYSPTTTTPWQTPVDQSGPGRIYGPFNVGGDVNYTQFSVGGLPLSVSSGGTPSLDTSGSGGTSCGGTGGVMAAGSTNFRGSITLGPTNTTTCSLTFVGGNYATVSGYSGTPVCIIQPYNSGGTLPVSISNVTAGFTFTFSSQNSTKYNYVCIG